MKPVDKAQLFAALRERIGRNLETVRGSQESTSQGATHEEARPEHAKDTRAVEASYLARGLAERVQTLESDIALLDSLALESFEEGDAIAVMAIVGLENEAGENSAVVIAPAGAGEKVEVDGLTVRVVTPTSPLGRGLMSRRVEDEFEVALPAGRQSFTIIWIQ
jgi:transcription elongation GreA/GreB family factor